MTEALVSRSRPPINIKHGGCRDTGYHPLYNTWSSMRSRCNDPNSRPYYRYGGRGITVCKRWDDFAVFVADMGPRPKGYSLDRIDNDGPYSPENCRWASITEQMHNRSCTVFVTLDGEKMPVTVACVRLGFSTKAYQRNLRAGMTHQQSVDELASRRERPSSPETAHPACAGAGA